MKELIDSILSAEAEAEKIVAEAKQKAAQILEQTTQEILAIKITAEEDVKNARRTALLKANEQADKLYQSRMAVAQKDGQALIQKAESNTQKAAEFIVGRILD